MCNEVTQLDILKRKIDSHYYHEAEIMLEILESNISGSERNELLNFMLNHPYAKVVDLIDNIKKKKSD